LLVSRINQSIKIYMKRFLSVLAASFLLHSLAQGQFYVIQVKGVIKNKVSSKLIKSGDQIGDNDQLVFSDKTSMAAVTHPQKGRMVLKPEQVSSSGSEFTGLVKNNLFPGLKHAMTRATLTSLPDLKDYLCAKPFVILDEVEVSVNSAILPLNDQAFCYLRFVYQGDTINKKIPVKDQKLLFSQKNIAQVDGKSIEIPENTSMELFHYDAGSKKSMKLGNFKPVFIQSEEFKTIVQKFFLPTNPDRKSMISDIRAYMTEMYDANIDESHLTKWLDANFGK